MPLMAHWQTRSILSYLSYLSLFKQLHTGQKYSKLGENMLDWLFIVKSEDHTSKNSKGSLGTCSGLDLHKQTKVPNHLVTQSLYYVVANISGRVLLHQPHLSPSFTV
jgi:hypothetical protein